MKKIGLLSDTHSHLNPKVLDFLKDCDEIWHAGDVGNEEILFELKKYASVRAVYGNIDDARIRMLIPEIALFEIEGLKVLMTHIGGYPGRYQPPIRKIIDQKKPGLFISGHSHILKVMPDKKRNLLHINPGAAGNNGFHHSITCVRFQIHQAQVNELEVLDIKRKK